MYMYTDWQHNYGAIPLLCSPCWYPVNFPSIPFYLLGNPPLAWCDPVHLGPRLLVNWPPPSHPLPIPSPFQIPNTSGQLCALLRRHRDPSFSWSGILNKLVQYVAFHFFLTLLQLHINIKFINFLLHPLLYCYFLLLVLYAPYPDIQS